MKSILALIQVGVICAAMSLGCAAQTSAHAKVLEELFAGELEQAAKLADGALRAHPNDATMILLKARVLLATGDLEAALSQLNRALRVAPARSVAHIDALYYLSLTANALAQQEFNQLYALAPESAAVHLLMAEAALAQENDAEAETEYRAAINADARAVEALMGLAELKRKQIKCDEAISLYQRAAALTGLNHDTAYGMGICYGAQQNAEQALHHLKIAAQLAPDAPATRFAYGNELMQSGQSAAAIPELKAAAALAPKMKQAYFLLGRAYRNLGQTTEAQAAFKQLETLTQQELERDQGHQPTATAPRKIAPNKIRKK